MQPKSSESSVKLPKITIKKFDGKPVHWTTFWDSYNVTLNLNESLSKVQKFTYLLSLLEGTASDTVSGFTLTDSKYDAAVDLLHERYSNKQLIINSHIQQLVQLPQITHEEHTKKSRNLLTDVETHVMKVECSEIDPLTEQVSRFWDLDSIGIKENEPSVYETFVENIKHDGTRYEVNLPWKLSHPMLPDNFALSLGRLRSLTK